MLTAELMAQLVLVQVGGASPTTAPVAPDWWGALAGLHPLVIHFPIALVIVAAFVEFFALIGRREQVTSFTLISLIVGGVLEGIAAWSGWELAEEGYGSGWALDLHRWLGVSSAVLVGALVIIALIARFTHKAWSVATVRAGVFVAAALIGATGHFGGEMVWGGSLLMDSLFPEQVEDQSEEKGSQSGKEPTTEPTTEPSNDESSRTQVSFNRDVKPIFDTYCWKCHGPEGRAKASIRLTTQAEILREIDGHALVLPGDPAKSLVHEVIVLPRDDDRAMPPKGPGLSETDIQTITTWIQEGAVFDDASQAAPSGTQRTAPARSPPAEKSASGTTAANSDTSAIDAALAKLKDRGVPARRVSQQSNDLDLNANGLSHRINPPFGDADMALLDGLQPVLVEVDLSNTAVTNSGISKLSSFDQLRTVKLKETRTGDAAAKILAALPAVTTVNFFGTDLEDSGLDALAQGAAMKTIYAGETKVTEAGVKAAEQLKPGLKIIWKPATVDANPAQPSATGPKTFKTTIEPILAANCWRCHGAGGDKFNLVTREDLLAQHNGKPIVDPGKPEMSLFYQAITVPRGEKGAMPPKGPGLSDVEKDQIRAWIVDGAA